MNLMRLACISRPIYGSTSRVGSSLGVFLYTPRNTVFCATFPGRERFASTQTQKPSNQPTTKDSGNKPPQPKSKAHLRRFFAKYPKFDYNPTNHYITEFHRMMGQFGWSSKGAPTEQALFRTARRDLGKASVLQFNANYGTDKNDLAAWKKIFDALLIGKVSKNIYGCKRRVRETYMNLCDLIEYHDPGKKVRLFKNEEELNDYTKRTGKFFPQDHPDAGELLRFLLRPLNFPSNRPTQSPPKSGIRSKAPKS